MTKIRAHRHKPPKDLGAKIGDFIGLSDRNPSTALDHLENMIGSGLSDNERYKVTDIYNIEIHEKKSRFAGGHFSFLKRRAYFWTGEAYNSGSD